MDALGSDVRTCGGPTQAGGVASRYQNESWNAAWVMSTAVLREDASKTLMRWPLPSLGKARAGANQARPICAAQWSGHERVA